MSNRQSIPVCDTIATMDASMRYPFEYFVEAIARGDAGTRERVKALEPGARAALEVLNERRDKDG